MQSADATNDEEWFRRTIGSIMTPAVLTRWYYAPDPLTSSHEAPRLRNRRAGRAAANSPAVFRPPRTRALPVAAEPAPQSIGFLMPRILVPHTAWADAVNMLEQGLRYRRAGGEPAHLSVFGETGTGKTRLLEEFAKGHPPVRDPEGVTAPVLYVKTPALPTAKNLAEATLFAIGDPAWCTGTESKQTNRLVTLLEACQVQMLILDDFQHFYDKGSHNVWHHVADWLKILVERAKVCLVVAGLPVAKLVLHQNEQLERRLRAPAVLPRFDWRSPSLLAEFQAILESLTEVIAEHIDLPPLHSDEMSFRIWCGSGGLLGYVVALLDQMLRDADDRKATSVSLADFHQAYLKAIAKNDDAASAVMPFLPEFTTHLDDNLHAKVASMGVRSRHPEDVADLETRARAGRSRKTLSDVFR